MMRGLERKEERGRKEEKEERERKEEREKSYPEMKENQISLLAVDTVAAKQLQ